MRNRVEKNLSRHSETFDYEYSIGSSDGVVSEPSGEPSSEPGSEIDPNEPSNDNVVGFDEDDETAILDNCAEFFKKGKMKRKYKSYLKDIIKPLNELNLLLELYLKK